VTDQTEALYCAVALANYILEPEWDMVRDEFSLELCPDFDKFQEWVVGFMYYNALVAKCMNSDEGTFAAVTNQLKEDYEELCSM
jgi:hypothetical protein